MYGHSPKPLASNLNVASAGRLSPSPPPSRGARPRLSHDIAHVSCQRLRSNPLPSLLYDAPTYCTGPDQHPRPREHTTDCLTGRFHPRHASSRHQLHCFLARPAALKFTPTPDSIARLRDPPTDARLHRPARLRALFAHACTPPKNAIVGCYPSTLLSYR